MKILFVCLGNICRSPLAEAVFKHKIREKRLAEHFEADSCGTANYHIGDPPDPRTIKNALKNGIKIQHLGRQFSAADFENYNMIVPMDHSNLASIMRLENASDYQQKIKLMREFDSIDKGSDVPDPYHGNENDFQEVFDILDRSVDGLISFLQKSKI